MAHAALDNWDPMAENYHDSNFNSYEHGPGLHLTPYSKNPTESEYKLYVNNIPPELNEEGIRQVFNTYGNVLNVMSPREAEWAFVTFGSFREAETAIRMLNDQKPLQLRVQFARKDNAASRKKVMQHRMPEIDSPPYASEVNNRCREYIEPVERPQYLVPPVRNLGRGQELASAARRAMAPHPVRSYRENDDLLYSSAHDPNLYDPYEDVEPFPETNNMWIRNRMKVSDDGTKFVTMGRGCTWYELPRPHPKVHQQIRAVYEKREAGLYQYGENKVSRQIGKCQYCTKPAVMRCQRCREFYCDRICQENDWKRHRIECQTMPDLEPGNNSVSLSPSSGEELPVEESGTQKPRKLRRPFKPAVAPVSNSSSIPFPTTSPKSEVQNVMPQTDTKTKGQENKPQSMANFKRNLSGEQKRASDESSTRNSIKNNDNQPVGNSKKPQNAVGSNERTVTQHDQLNENPFNRSAHSNSTEKTDQQISIQFKNLNISNTESAKPSLKPLLDDPDVGFRSIRDIPTSFTVKPQPKVCFSLSESNAASADPGNPSTFKTVNDNVNKKAHVQPSASRSSQLSKIMGSHQTVATSSAPKVEPKNVVDLLEKEEEGCFEVHVLLGGQKAAVTTCVLKIQDEYSKISNELKIECEKIPTDPNFKPKVGDFVCGKRLDDWIRGIVTSLGPPIRLAAIDEGRVESVTAVKPLPQGFESLPMLGAICELIKGDFKFERMAQYLFIVEKISGKPSEDGIEVIVFSPDDKEGKGILKPWTPAPEQKGVPYASLTSGTEVYLVSFRSLSILFARSLVPKDMETFNRVTQEVAKWSTKVNKLKELPVEGEMVIAKFSEDNNFYRAIVRQIKENKIVVSYLDFGNIEVTTLDNLFPISDQLKEYPSCVARISLKDVPKDKPMNMEISEYLAKLAGTEQPMMCTFEGSPYLDGVILRTPKGTCVNNKIIEYLTPSWQKEENKTTAFMLSDLEVAELGSAGTTLNVLVLHSYGSLMHAMAPYDLDLIQHITDIMATQIQQYCTQTKEHYIPRQDELCLAPYEGMYYRAVCLEPNTSSTTSTLNFIDFGNIAEVSHTEIRLITKDFMTTKTLANICQVRGLGAENEDDLPPGIAARVSELVPSNDIITIKIVEFIKPGEYIVELPTVRDILIKEGLLKL